MDKKEKNKIIENYRKLFLKYGEGPFVGQWSLEGQRFRFDKLSDIAKLTDERILEIGCGIGDFYPYLKKKYERINYTGIDIVPELIEYAKIKYPNVEFHCVDLLSENFEGRFDYVLMSGVFNNKIENTLGFLYDIISAGYRLCKKGIGFNFTSTYVNHTDPGMAYYNPTEILKYCIEELSKKVILSHHYERCDVSVFVYR